MKNRILSLVFAVTLTVSMSSCFTMEHTVGNGAQGSSVQKTKQWYALFGLVPINSVDTKSMASGTSDYTIKTQIGFVDYLISIVTGIVTVYPMSVEVQK